MNKTIYNLTVIAFFISILSIGCNKAEVPSESTGDGTEEKEIQERKFVGTWEYSSILFKNGQLLVSGTEIGTFVGHGKEIEGTIEVSQNPNVYTSTLEFVAEVTGLGDTQDIPVDSTTTTGTWRVENGAIVLSQDDGSEINVISSSENEIVFEGSFIEEVPSLLGDVIGVSDVELTVVK